MVLHCYLAVQTTFFGTDNFFNNSIKTKPLILRKSRFTLMILPFFAVIQMPKQALKLKANTNFNETAAKLDYSFLAVPKSKTK